MRTLLLLSLTFVIACGAPPKRDTTPAPPRESQPGESDARGPLKPQIVEVPVVVEPSLLDRLTVEEPVLEGYNRKSWKHWTDEDHDCQDTRQEVLIAESEVPVGFKTKKTCKVAVGRWTCPYTGEVFTDPSKLDVDHMIPLGAAHAAGGHAWDAERREAFANELGDAHHLIAVKASANRSKGKHGPSEWLPEDETYWCRYVRDWVDIKVRWELTVSLEEKDILEEYLQYCEGVPEGEAPRL